MAIQIRKLTPLDIPAALRLVWEVFRQFEAPDYSFEGINTFKSFIDDDEMVNCHTFHGAFLEGEIVGVAATRPRGSHIALFFVDSRYHRQCIGRGLFEALLMAGASNKISVNSSPYASELYSCLGFSDTYRWFTKNNAVRSNKEDRQ